MKKAIWFSRHVPTPEQIEDAASRGYVLTPTPEGAALGDTNLADNGDVYAVVTALLSHCADKGAVAIFGVFASPILGQIARTFEDILARGQIQTPSEGEGDHPCFAAWNVTRAMDGWKPTFEHREFVGIGRLNQKSVRWLK